MKGVKTKDWKPCGGAVKTRYINANCRTGAILPRDSLGTESQQATLRMILSELFDFGVLIGIQPDPSPDYAQTEIVRINDGRINQKIDFRENGLAVLWRGENFDADGLILDDHARKRNMGFFIISGRCPKVAIYSEEIDTLLMVHAGFKSLIPTVEIDGGPRRHYPSVIDRAREVFPRAVRANLKCAICLGMSSGYKLSTNHPVHGKHSAGRIAYLAKHFRGALEMDNSHPEEAFLYMPKLIELQLRELGVRTDIEFDGIDVETDKKNGKYIWRSESRTNERDGSVFALA